VGLKISGTIQPGAFLPTYASVGSAGADVRAFLTESVTIEPGERFLVPTGLKLQIPQGFEGQVRPRSGLAVKHGVTVLNSPGTIDSDYRGEIKVVLINLSKAPFVVEPGARIAQLVIAPVSRVEYESAELLDPSHRGDGGFGSTGV
jgi:dUTP pyrophosphatase